MHKCLCIVFAHWAAITNWCFCQNPSAMCWVEDDGYMIVMQMMMTITVMTMTVQLFFQCGWAQRHRTNTALLHWWCISLLRKNLQFLVFASFPSLSDDLTQKCSLYIFENQFLRKLWFCFSLLPILRNDLTLEKVSNANC